MSKPIFDGIVDVYVDISRERARQEERHPDDTCWELGKDAREKWGVLRDEVEEVWDALLFKNRANLRAELIQVAAVAVAWVQALDRAGAEEATR